MPGVKADVYPRIAEQLGIPVPHVWDLATHDDEVATTLSLRQAQKLSSVTGIGIAELIGCDPTDVANPIDASNFCAAVRSHISATYSQISQFEEAVGWSVEKFLLDPDRLYDLANWDCLRNVASSIGIDPIAVLPRSNKPSEQDVDPNA